MISSCHSVNDHFLTCSGVQQIAKAMMTMTTILVTLFLFSCPLPLLALSLLGPWPCVAAVPLHSLSSMFKYNHEMARSGTASEVTKNNVWYSRPFEEDASKVQIVRTYKCVKMSQ